jgi:hypothetical protein
MIHTKIASIALGLAMAYVVPFTALPSTVVEKSQDTTVQAKHVSKVQRMAGRRTRPPYYPRCARGDVFCLYLSGGLG